MPLSGKGRPGTEWDLDRQGRTAAGCVGDGAPAAVRLRDRVDDREPEAGTADRALSGAAVEPPEDAVAHRGWDAGAVIAHPQLRSRGVQGAADLDPTAGRRVLCRVVRQLQPRLQEAIAVAVDDAPRALLHTPGVTGDHGHEFTDALRQRREIDIAHREAVGLDRREQVDVADEARHAVELGHAELPGGGGVGGVVRIHDLEVSAHDRDRGLQLVTDIVEEAALHLERRFGAVARRRGRERCRRLEDRPPDERGDDERREGSDAVGGDRTPGDVGIGEREDAEDRKRGHREPRPHDRQHEAERTEVAPAVSPGGHRAGHPVIMARRERGTVPVRAQITPGASSRAGRASRPAVPRSDRRARRSRGR